MNFKTFKKGVVLGVAVLAICALSVPAAFAAALPGGTLNPRNIPKYVRPLVIPPAMPKTGPGGTYDIEVVPHMQQILPLTANDGTPLGQTPVWTYGAYGSPATRNYPAFTVEVTRNLPTSVRWRNNLVDGTGAFLPHLLGPVVDQTLHWANPPAVGCRDGTDTTDCATNNQNPYLGPVPIITHVHGAHTNPQSDGYPEAWYLPAANNIGGYTTMGTLANGFGVNNTFPGYADFTYPNTQPSTTLWYHDHTLGMTRLNVYAGPAGFWLIRDSGGGETGLVSGTLPGPAPDTTQDPVDPTGVYEIPIVIQDRSFNALDANGNNTLFYPDNRAFFEGFRQAQQLKIPFVGDPAGRPSDIAPIWNPEAFFNVMVVNGVSWPFLNVESRRYRFRLLNGCNSRFLNLSLQALDRRGKVVGELPFYQIGGDQGLLPNVVQVQTGTYSVYSSDGSGTPIATITAPVIDPQQALLLAPAERADVIVDFSAVVLPAGTVRVRMINTAPDAPFGGFPDIPADPNTSGQVMEFVVGAVVGDDSSTPAANLQLSRTPLGAGTSFRELSLNEEESSLVCVSISPSGRIKYLANVVPPYTVDFLTDCAAAGGAPFAPKAALLGTYDSGTGTTVTKLWSDTITETPVKDAIEEWDFYNLTVDAHPIHIHLVHFEVIDRQPIAAGAGSNIVTPNELGFKDTVIAYPGEVTTVKAKFDIEGLYVWHCHIVEHEDNEMMRPYCVGGATAPGCAGL